ncbi:MAG: ATP-binding cassette domain-containing protein [Beijerinckiaceae bacterium]|nr:ATP-binding cassette domain-containing protein [Beijerinckiaceae bacterium]
MGTPAIVVSGLTVQFGSFRALDGLSLAVEYGQIHALIGPNGAGKTTLLDAISGITRSSGGSISLNGLTELTRCNEVDIALSGIRRKFQKPSVFEALSVRDNIALGIPSARQAGLVGQSAIDQRIEATLDVIGLAEQSARLAGELAHGQKQWLEIGIVLASDPKVLMLDEPVAGLTDEETERTGVLLRKLKHPARAIILVEHDMDFVEQVADRVTVLHEGKTLFEGSMKNARLDPGVIDVYLGR